MTEDQARTLFSRALDGELHGTELEAFEGCLAAHPDLSREYEAFCATLARTRGLNDHVRVPDLLPGVQQKLRKRGRRGMEHLRGRGFPTTMVLALVTLALAGALWLAFSLIARLTGTG